MDRDGGDLTHCGVANEYRRKPLRKEMARTVEVKENQASGRSTGVVDLRDRLLTSITPLG
jgi:hypothetical protein